jgi:hypothetical protein
MLFPRLRYPVADAVVGSSLATLPSLLPSASDCPGMTVRSQRSSPYRAGSGHGVSGGDAGACVV